MTLTVAGEAEVSHSVCVPVEDSLDRLLSPPRPVPPHLHLPSLVPRRHTELTRVTSNGSKSKRCRETIITKVISETPERKVKETDALTFAVDFLRCCTLQDSSQHMTL